MDALSFTEENYLKAIYQMMEEEPFREGVGTSDLAAELKVAAPTVSDMARKLKKKGLVFYQRYRKIELTPDGKSIALEVIRRHRLWETFLYDKLDFSWDEVHEVAEELEHIKSLKLIEKLDQFLGYPQFDPHGDAIPSKTGEIAATPKRKLSEVTAGTTCRVVAVRDSSAVFLKYVTQLGLGIDFQVKVLTTQDFDGSMEIDVNGKTTRVSRKFAENILIV